MSKTLHYDSRFDIDFVMYDSKFIYTLYRHTPIIWTIKYAEKGLIKEI